MKIDGISAIAVILIASFAIDRITAGLLFLLSFIPLWRRVVPDPLEAKNEQEVVRAKKRHQLLYFTFAGFLGIIVLAWFGTVRIFSVLGFPQIDPILDTVVTGLILVAGSERISGLLEASSGFAGSAPAEKAEPAPIEVKGTVTLEDPADGLEGR